MSSASIDAAHLLAELKVQLAKFAEEAGAGVVEADAEVGRTLRWLEGEAKTGWEFQLKKRQEKLQIALEELRKKQLYKAVDGTTPSTVDERKAVQKWRAAVEEAEAKLKAVKSWRIKLEQEANNYRGAVSPVARSVESDVPNAMADLDRMMESLDAYFRIGQSMHTPAAANEGAASMARAVDEDAAARPDEKGAQP